MNILSYSIHQLRRPLQHIALWLILFLAAFLPRVTQLGYFITSDEANFWMWRSAAFLQALQSGNHAATTLSTHPGVTTMWLGSLGILLHQLVIYLRDAQGQLGPPFDSYYLQQKPVFVVRIHNIDFVWVYQVSPSYEHASPATFGTGVQLLGYTITPSIAPGQPLQLRTVWQSGVRPTDESMVFIHVFSQNHTHVAQADIPINPERWGSQRYHVVNVPLTLPSTLSNAQYSISLGVYDPTTGQRLKLTTPLENAFADDGPDALLLDQVTFP